MMKTERNPDRYDRMVYRRVGKSGLKLPVISFGLWQNFGITRDLGSATDLITHAFDAGITHFDLANNYGPPPGATETLFGQILKSDLSTYRDEIIVSSKAGYEMWPGPYGNFGSRKYMIASCDQSLKRLGLDYVDIFYSHRFDPDTPLAETMGALADIVRQGKALYVGISSYPREQTVEAHSILKEMGVPLLIHQPSYSILNRWIEEDGTMDACDERGVGIIAYGALGHGLLSGKHRTNVGSVDGGRVLPEHHQDPKALEAASKVSSIAEARGQTPAQLALAWCLRKQVVCSALIGVRTLDQLKENLAVLERLDLSPEDIEAIDAATAEGRIDRRPHW